MVIADRLRALREAKHYSQGEIEKRTGLLRCYVSRVENGHTVPAIETLEKFARALDVPMYELFYDGEGTASFSIFRNERSAMMSHGEALARMKECFTSFAAS